MTRHIHISSDFSDLGDILGRPLRTKGCILLFCLQGYAVVECNFVRRPLRKGSVAMIFSDTLFSVEKMSAGFKARRFELSASLSDEATFISSGHFFDWLSDNPVCAIPSGRWREVSLWLEGMEWIEHHAESACREVMTRNHWQNFFLGFESAVRHLLEERGVRTISSSRLLFNRFCQLLCENCRNHHDVKFYADRLCITPYYLSRVTHHIFRVSPKELIDRQLVMEIKALLTSTDLSVKEIADSYCFESASYLGRYFRRHVGMTPLDYRGRHSATAATRKLDVGMT